jgi:hypothetical protein
MKLILRIIIISILTFSVSSQTFGQVYSDKVVGKKNEALKDSIEAKPYPYKLPIWGAKVAALGYDLPYSAGVSVNYFTQESSLILSNLYVGFNNGPQLDLNEIVRFDDCKAAASATTVRPDIWLFPFLNVYGLIGKGNSSTTVNAGIYVPNLNGEWNQIYAFSTKANFTVSTFGFGMTPTMGIGGGWLALDMNCAWTNVSALDKPVFTYVFGPRLGKTFKFKKPEQNIAVWVGGFRVQFTSETSGSMNLSEVVPVDQLQPKIDAGMQKVENGQTAVNDWWTGLKPIEKTDPVNIAKYQAATRVLDRADNLLTNMDNALNDDKSATVQYSLDKNLKDKWNFLVGSQYQYNKHIMLRAEYGFLGSRQQFMCSLQYRFRL